jgi:type I restriction enzyme S subunit
MGSLDVLKDKEIGLVSPAYSVYKFNTELVDIDFMSYLLRSPKLINLYGTHSQKGASIVRRNLDKDQLMSEFLQIPCLEEQKKIASFLTALDDKISIVKQQLELTKQYKQGLLQQMFV